MDSAKLIDRHAAIYAINTNASDFARQIETNTDSDWALVLIAEFGEWANAVKGKHEDSPAYELIQMGGIIQNMLTRYGEQHILNALDTIRARHFPAGRAALAKGGER